MQSGSVSNDDLLDQLFSRFCVGKTRILISCIIYIGGIRHPKIARGNRGELPPISFCSIRATPYSLVERYGRVKKPTVYIVSGANGAGKTTFASEFLPDFVDCKEFLNADLIAAGLSPFAPETQNVRAGRLLLSRVHELAEAKRNFGFETTLSGRGYLRLLSEMKTRGYRVVLFFLWLPNTDLAVSRVANRVRQGGHNIPEADIRRRFESGLQNLFKLYRPLLDVWWLYDASEMPPAVIAKEEDGKVNIATPDLYEQITQTVEEQSHDR